jgi:hypothetical protein
MENDKIKYRGHYRQTIFALKTLSRYNFTSVLAIQNFYNLSQEILIENFTRIFNKKQAEGFSLGFTHLYLFLYLLSFI